MELILCWNHSPAPSLRPDETLYFKFSSCRIGPARFDFYLVVFKLTWTARPSYTTERSTFEDGSSPVPWAGRTKASFRVRFARRPGKVPDRAPIESMRRLLSHCIWRKRLRTGNFPSPFLSKGIVSVADEYIRNLEFDGNLYFKNVNCVSKPNDHRNKLKRNIERPRARPEEPACPSQPGDRFVYRTEVA